MTEKQESELDPLAAGYTRIIDAGDHWMRRLEKGQVFRILDLEGNQAVDTLFYNANDPTDRYSACDTIQGQGKLYLTTDPSYSPIARPTCSQSLQTLVGVMTPWVEPVPGKATPCAILSTRNISTLAGTVFCVVCRIGAPTWESGICLATPISS